MLGNNDTEQVSAAAYVTFIVTLTHPRRGCMTPHQHAGYWSRSLRLRPCWAQRPSGTSSYITRVWKWWNGLAKLLHYQRMITSAQAGGSFFTHPQGTKKRYGWMIGTHNRETIKANTHRHRNNIKEILIFHEFASLSRTFKHQRRPIRIYSWLARMW